MKHFFKLLLLATLVTGSASSQSAQFTMVLLAIDPDRPKLPQRTVDSLQEAHLANIQKLSNEGKVVIAGPFDGGGGIFVLSTAFPDTARRWLSTDPAIRSKRWIIEAFPYIPRIGSVCKVVIKYEMATYGFVRFQWKEGNPEGHLLRLVHPDSVVAAGILEGNGSIVIHRGTPDESALRKERAVREGMVDVSVKHLWIARGSFCEK